MSENLHFSLRQTGPIPLDLTLSCRPGEILVLAGPSGSGKTTVLRSLAGLYRPAYGQIQLGATWLLNTEQGLCLPPQQRPVGLVFQHDALFPHLNARDNVTLALLQHPHRKRQRAALAWLEKVALAHRAEAMPATLSGGERQRLALARALAREPKVLLLDEPFAALDLSLRQQLLGELARLRDSLNLAVIWVTHDLEEARLVADRLALLDQGRLLQAAPPNMLWRYPASAEVAQMLGYSNLLQVTRTATGFEWAEGELATVPDTPHSLGTASVGTVLTLALAPEAICLSSPEGEGWSGQVLHSVRLGNRWRVELVLSEGTRLQCWSQRAVSTGERLKLSWAAEALRPLGRQRF